MRLRALVGVVATMGLAGLPGLAQEPDTAELLILDREPSGTSDREAGNAATTPLA